MDRNDEHSTQAVARRRILQSGAAVAIAGLAGCLSSGSDGTDTGNGNDSGDGDGNVGTASSLSVGRLEINGRWIVDDPSPQTGTASQVTIKHGEDVPITFSPGNSANRTIEAPVRLTIGPETRTRTITFAGRREPQESEEGIVSPTAVVSIITMSGITDDLPPGTYDVVLTVDGTEDIVKEDALRVAPWWVTSGD